MWWTLRLAGTAKLLVVGHSVHMRCGAQKSDRFGQILAECLYLHISGAEANNKIPSHTELKIMEVVVLPGETNQDWSSF